MQIDWLTVAAQIVNFLVLVWLLQRFLYKPITEAMRRREERIEERLAEARATRAAAEEETERLRQKEEALKAASDGILGEARSEAEELRKELEAELRAEIEDKRAVWHEQLDEEREEFGRRLQRRAGHELLDIAARVFADFADSDLSDGIVGRFIERVKGLDKDRLGALAEAAGRADQALVETGRPLAPATRGRITRALHKALSSEIRVEYREDDDVLLGVRLTVGEQTVEWSAARHLRRLGTKLDEILESESHRSPGAGRERDGDDARSPA